MTSHPAFGLFDPGNVGSYPGRVERVRPGQLDMQILDLRATDDRHSTVLSVSLSVQPAGTPIALPLQAPTAHIEWGVGSGRDSVDVDFLRGQVLTIAGTFVRVTAAFPLASHLVLQPDGSLGPAPAAWGVTDPSDDNQVLALGASVSQSAHPQAAFGATPRLTTFVLAPSAPAGGLSAPVPVPNHAQSVTLLAPGNFTFGEVLISALSTTSPASQLYSEPAVANLDVGSFPIGRGVRFVQLSNGSDTDFVIPLLWTIGL